MMKKTTKTTNNNHEGLTIGHLSNIYETARTVLHYIPIGQFSTADQLAAALKKLVLPKNRQDLVMLFRTLQAMEAASLRLAATTLVKPADHALAQRLTLEAEGKTPIYVPPAPLSHPRS
jgi:hypothetical protein